MKCSECGTDLGIEHPEKIFIQMSCPNCSNIMRFDG